MTPSTSSVCADAAADVSTHEQIAGGGLTRPHPDVSLVVSTVGRPDALHRLIRSLEDEVRSGLAVELIVVDQSLDQQCRSVLTVDIGPEPLFSWVYLRSSPGVSRGRNVGLAAARGRFVMFPDDDAWFSGDTLVKAVAILEGHPDHHGLCTQLQDGHGEPSMLRWADSPREVTKRNHHRTSIGSTMLFRTEVARAVDGFNEEIGPGAGSWYGSCEDADYLLRIIEAGHRIWYDPAVVMNHRDSRRDGGPDARRKALEYGCGQGWFWRQHHFPRWLIFTLALRRIMGGMLWSLRGRPDIGMAHRAWVRGAINGWFGRRPLDLSEVESVESSGSKPPTEVEFGRSFSWRLVLAPLGTAATFALTTIATRNMTPGGVAVFYAVLAALMIGPILGRFGLNQWAVRDLAALRTREEPAVAVALARRFTLSATVPALVAAPTVSILFVAGSAQRGSAPWLVLLATVILVAETLRLTISDTFIGLGMTGWSAFLAHQVRAIAVTAVVVVYLVATSSSMDLFRMLELMAVVVVILAAVGIYRLWSLPSEPSDGSRSIDLRRVLQEGRPFLLVDLVVVVIARGDVWLAGPIFPDNTAALYGTASVLAAQIGVPIGLASIALAPVVSGYVAQGRLDSVERSIRSLVTVVLYVLVPVVIVLVVFGERLLGAVYGSSYAGAHPYLMTLMVGNVTLALLGAAPVVLLMAGCQRDAMKVSGVWFTLIAPVAVAAAVLVGPMGLAVTSALATVGLYTALATTAWVATGMPLLPYANPGRLDIRGWAKSLRAGMDGPRSSVNVDGAAP